VAREVARMLLHLAARRGMLIGEINGAAAQSHVLARVFVSEGFVSTAMGLQARTDRIVPRGYGSLDSSGIGIAATRLGGDAMAEQNRTDIENDPTLIGNSRPRQNETSDTEHDRVRESNDTDQAMERGGIESKHNRGYDEAVRGGDRRDIDPDSAEADVDRDDTSDSSVE
jgi:hypothetical protein